MRQPGSPPRRSAPDAGRQRVAVPGALRRSATAVFAVAGETWVDSLPDLIQQFLAEWNLASTCNQTAENIIWYAKRGLESDSQHSLWVADSLSQ